MVGLGNKDRVVAVTTLDILREMGCKLVFRDEVALALLLVIEGAVVLVLWMARLCSVML